MGRNKIKIEKIKNDRIRQVTFYKRKRGLLKKAMELSLLCDVKVFLCIVDKNEKMMIFTSENDVGQFKNDYLDHHATAREVFTHKDYKEIFKDYKAEDDLEKEVSENEDEDDQQRTVSEDGEEQKVRKSKQSSKYYNSNLKKESPKKKDAESNNLSSFKEPSEEGISKIKQKLSLKVLIPDNKQIITTEKVRSVDSEAKLSDELSFKKESFTNKIENSPMENVNVFKSKLGLKIDTKKAQNMNSKIDNFNEPHPMTKGHNTPSKNISSPNINLNAENSTKIINNNYLNMPSVHTPNALSNPFQLSFENFMISHKRYRDDSCNFSPNLNTGVLKAFTPVRDYYSPNLPNIFMFNHNPNNSESNTPLGRKGPSTLYTPTEIKCENSKFDYNLNKSDSITINDLSSASENNAPSQQTSTQSNTMPKNTVENVNNVNIDIPNIFLLSTTNPNLGFYTWVMQGSTHPNDIKNKNLRKKRKNLKNFKESDDGGYSSE